MKQARTEPELTVEVKDQEWELTLEGEPVLRCELTWPECIGTWQGLRDINRYYDRVVQVWRERWEREVYVQACLDLADRRAQGRPFRPWQAKLTTQITREGEGLLSLVQDAAEQAGYDRPVTVRRGDTWSLDSGVPRTLASFFSPNRRWKKRLLAQVEEQAAQRLASGESLLDSDCVQKLRKLFDSERFCLTGKGVQVFFPMYALGPGAEGIPAFDVELPLQ